jgi:hypothetical protein
VAGVDEAGFDSGRDFGALAVFDGSNERLEIADIRFFKERFKRWLLGASALLVLTFQICFLQRQRVFQDERGNFERRLRSENWAFVSVPG